MAANSNSFRKKGKHGDHIHMEVVARTNLLLTLGRDVNLDKVDILAKRDLIGKVDFISMSEADIKNWGLDSWTPILQYKPRLSFLLNSQEVFHFLEEVDLLNILSVKWVRGKRLL